MAIDINTIGLFHCRAESSAVTDTIHIIEKEDIGEYGTVEDVTRKMIGCDVCYRRPRLVCRSACGGGSAIEMGWFDVSPHRVSHGEKHTQTH
ncbi:hypothetical protein GCM10009067_40360 [Haloarcula sebkhae]|uniref:Uncharacterized protein n=1 Tax=Haloarcula sebkhae TaxID=932660 RepID=A0A830EX71_9EURY|nr:hypothetical protein GCM10009067_40360 [Haloarcula sebkhae]